MRTRLLLLAAFIGIGLLLIGSSLAHVFDGAAAPSGPTLYLSASGSDSNSCTQARPCQTFQHAYDIAKPTQVVEVAAGKYPVQIIHGDRKAPKLLFRPSKGANVFVDEFDVYADQLVLSGFHTGFWASFADSDGFTAKNIDTGPFIIYGSQNTSIIGGDIGPSWGNGSPTNVAFITYGANDTPPRNVVVDHAYFHDFKLGNVDDHVQCVMVVGGNGLTIRNSRFERCDGYSIFFTQWAGPEPAQNVLLENNFFGQSTADGSLDKCCAYYAVSFSQHMDFFKNITVRNNSSVQEISMYNAGPKTNVSYIANVSPLGSCIEGVTYAYNISEAKACGRTDRHAASGFVDPRTLNLHLKPHAAAINRGDPKSFPKRDIDGQLRPQGKRVDAGADERLK